MNLKSAMSYINQSKDGVKKKKEKKGEEKRGGGRGKEGKPCCHTWGTAQEEAVRRYRHKGDWSQEEREDDDRI